MVFYFFQKYLGCPELGENGAPHKDSFISSIPKWFSNSNEILNSSSRNGESHTSFGKILKNIPKLLKRILNLKGQWLSENW